MQLSVFFRLTSMAVYIMSILGSARFKFLCKVIHANILKTSMMYVLLTGKHAA